MKLKEGMKIKIKSWEEMEKEGKSTIMYPGTHCIKFEKHKIVFDENMKILCGVDMEITKSEEEQFNSANYFRIAGSDGKFWSITEEMFTIIENDIYDYLEPSNIIESKNGYRKIIIKVKDNALYAMDNNGVICYITALEKIEKVYSIKNLRRFDLDDLMNPCTFDNLTELIWEKENEEFESLPYNTELIVIKSGKEFTGTKIKFNDNDFLIYTWKDDKGKNISVSYSEDEIKNYEKGTFEFKLKK